MTVCVSVCVHKYVCVRMNVEEKCIKKIIKKTRDIEEGKRAGVVVVEWDRTLGLIASLWSFALLFALETYKRSLWPRTRTTKDKDSSVPLTFKPSTFL